MSAWECPTAVAGSLRQSKKAAASFAPGAAVVFGTNGSLMNAR